jgi:hypothetical protein
VNARRTTYTPPTTTAREQARTARTPEPMRPQTPHAPAPNTDPAPRHRRRSWTAR